MSFNLSFGFGESMVQEKPKDNHTVDFHEQVTETGYVHSNVNIRTGRGTKYPIMGVLKPGNKFKVGYLKDEWFAIFDIDITPKVENIKGYVYAALVKDVPKAKTVTKRGSNHHDYKKLLQDYIDKYYKATYYFDDAFSRNDHEKWINFFSNEGLFLSQSRPPKNIENALYNLLNNIRSDLSSVYLLSADAARYYSKYRYSYDKKYLGKINDKQDAALAYMKRCASIMAIVNLGDGVYD